MIVTIRDAIQLPCGLELSNRLVKSAMAESLARYRDGLPNELHETLYRQWAEANFGLVITGNVQVDSSFLGTPWDVYVDSRNRSHPAWSRWAQACKGSDGSNKCLVQLCHTGRQSPRGNGRAPWRPSIAPSPIPLNAGDTLIGRIFSRMLFGTPREMDEEDFDRVTAQFALAAETVHNAGFDGVQIHCSHGYLLASIMSPMTNRRTDKYGATPKDRLRLLLQIIDIIRATCPSTFCVSVKLNCSDFVQGGLTEDDAMQQVLWISEHGGVDIIEISGGSYEQPTFTQEANTGNKREAFFSSFSRRCKAELSSSTLATKPIIMVTGGFRTRSGMNDALKDQAADLIGIARPACLEPDTLPSKLLDSGLEDEKAVALKYRIKGVGLLQAISPIKVVGAGFTTIGYWFQLFRLGRGDRPDLNMSFAQGFFTELLPKMMGMR